MNRRMNKILTDQYVELTDAEIANLSNTLSGVTAAGGGTGESKYYGDNVNIAVNETQRMIQMTPAAVEKLNRTIPTTVAELTDKADYETTAHAGATYLTQASADTLYGTTGDVSTLKTASSNWDAAVSVLAAKSANGTWLIADDITGKQDKLTDAQLSAISSVSSVRETLIVGDANIQCTSSYVAGDDNRQLLRWALALTAAPSVTDTTLSGYNGIEAIKDSAVSSQWNVGLADDLYSKISQVPNLVTDVGNLKTASSTWYTQASGDARYQLKGDYAESAYVQDASANTRDVVSGWVSANFYAKTDTSSKAELTTALAGKEDEVTWAYSGQGATAAIYGANGHPFAVSSLPDTEVLGMNGVSAQEDTNIPGKWIVGLNGGYVSALDNFSGKVDKPAKTTGNNAKYQFWNANYDEAASGWLGAKQVVMSWCKAWGYDDKLDASAIKVNTVNNQITLRSDSDVSSISAATYYPNTANDLFRAQRLFIVTSDDDLIAHTSDAITNGQGSLFFVCSSHQ